MEQVFEKLQKDGKNNIDKLIKWMKEAKVIDVSREAEDKARKLFGSDNPQNVPLDKFKEVLQKIASEQIHATISPQKKNFDELNQNLASEGNKMMDKLMAGASTLKDKLKK